MRVYNLNSNCTDVQIQTGVFFLLFDVTKTTPADNLPSFFGDLDFANADRLKVLYSSPKGGQKVLIASLPVLPLALAGTMGPQHLKCYLNDAGKITRVVFPVMIGAGGALSLDNSTYISVSTSFTGLAANSGDEKSLRIYAVDTIKTPLAYMYEVVHLNASAQKAVDLTNVNQLIMSKEIDDFQLMSKDTEYSVNWSEPEISAVARAQNDIAASFGKDLTGNKIINGATVAVDLGFEATKFASGGTYCNALGVSDFLGAKVTAKNEDRLYLLRATSVNG